MRAQVQTVTTQAQSMVAQANRHGGRHVNTIASRLRDFTRMCTPMFFGSKVNEDPNDFVK